MFEIVPHIADTVTGRELVRALLAYLLSFLVTGRFWDSHRIFFQHNYRADARVVWVNLAVLLWVTLIPATAALLLVFLSTAVARTLARRSLAPGTVPADDIA